MITFQRGKTLLVIGLLLACCVFFAASLYVKSVQEKYVAHTQALVDEQELTLALMAQQLESELSDDVVSEIIKDCSTENRVRFDELLGKLSELRGAELLEVKQLFNACGDYFALRKAVMTARFEKEVDVYRDLVEILTLSHPKAETITHNPEKWQSIVELEKQRSSYSSALVDVQGQIIELLIAGMPVSSEAVQTLLAKGQDARVQLVNLGQQIAEAKR